MKRIGNALQYIYKRDFRIQGRFTDGTLETFTFPLGNRHVPYQHFICEQHD